MIDTNLAQRDFETIRSVLNAVTYAPATIVAAPPGSGKTTIVERVAAQQVGLHHENVAIATTTRSQAQALVMRLRNWNGLTPVWFVPKTQRVKLPSDIVIARSVGEIPEYGVAVVATAAKWARTNGFDVPLLVVDEAWQLPFADFAPLTPIAERYLLVGDPGQLDPYVEADVSRWSDDPGGPHRPAPEALRARNVPGVVQVALPATRRLPASTAEIVSDAFYPQMPFGSLAEEAILDYSGFEGRSMIITEVGEQHEGVHDPEMAVFATQLARDIIEGGKIIRGGKTVRVRPEDVGIVCPYVHQVPQIRAALGLDLAGVWCETANRWQGLERDIIIGLHPLSGQPEPTGFAMDAGRLCVMVSRHRVAVMLIGRPGLVQAAATGQGAAERRFGDDRNPARRGWRAHSVLLQATMLS
jgi:hypothetical protein